MDLLAPVLDACAPVVLDFLLDVEAGAADVLDADGRTSSGETKRSLYVTPPTSDGAQLTGAVGASAPHAQFVRDGRPPGKWPPYMAIEEWVEREFGFAEAPYPLVQAVRRKIGERGTDGTDFLGRPIDALMGFFLADLTDTAQRAAGDAANVTLKETADGLGAGTGASLTLEVGLA